MDPLEILPVEMWKCVLDKLPSHDDLQSAQNTGQLWRSLLTGTQTEWMFQGVFPSLQKFLLKSDILNSRRVCKSWKKTIDFNLENGQPTIMAPGRRNYESCRKQPRTLEVDLNKSAHRLKISTTEVMKRFQKEFGAYDMPKNPFVSRSLKLTIRETDATALEVLKKFGVHLRCLHLCLFQEIPTANTSPVTMAKFLWKVLKYVPNLRKLIFLTNMEPNNEHFVEMSEEEKQAQKLELEQFFKNNPVPPLPMLDNLDVGANAHPMLQVLKTAYVRQVSKYVHSSPKDLGQTNLVNLKELDWYFHASFPEKELNKLKDLGCSSLQRLELTMSCFIANFHYNFATERLFEAIETYRNTLTHLSLIFIYFVPKISAQLNLPFVQELSLEINLLDCDNSFNLYFLRSFSSLRKLKFIFWECSYYDISMIRQDEGSKSAKDAVDLHYFLNEKRTGGPYKSNIWQLLPSLDSIEITTFTSAIQTEVYTRVEKATIA